MQKPKTVKEAVEILKAEIPEQRLAQIKDMRENNLSSLHHNLGTSIRNEFRLWGYNQELLMDCKKCLKDNFPEDMKVFDEHYLIDERREFTSEGNAIHPDDASYIIIKSLWKELNLNKE